MEELLANVTGNDIDNLLNEIHDDKGNPSTQQSSKIEKDYDDYEEDQLFCLYPADAMASNSIDDTKLYLRKSPFTGDVHPNKPFNKNNLIRHDKENNIYYLPLGIAPDKLAFTTSQWKWPEKYTIFMWVKWKANGTIATFDSSSYTPIYGYGGRLGVAGRSGWKTMDDYKCVKNKWQCVIVYGGDRMSRFYIGDLFTEPKSVGQVTCDISGERTCRIGNSRQGPGDVGCIYVFDKHKSMECLMELYHESMLMMGNYWSKEDFELIRNMLVGYMEIHGIVKIVFGFILGRLVDQFAL